MRDLIVSQQELAAWLTLSARRVRELTKAGVLQKDTQYRLRASVRRYIQFLRTESGSLSGERARLVKSQADLSELKLRQRTGELVLRDAVEKFIFAMNRRVRDNFLNLPARTDALLAAESDRKTCFAILEKEVRQILTGLANSYRQEAEVERTHEPRIRPTVFRDP